MKQLVANLLHLQKWYTYFLKMIYLFIYLFGVKVYMETLLYPSLVFALSNNNKCKSFTES